MKKLLALLLIPGLAGAADVTARWTLPTTAVDGTALTGAQALTSVQVFLATSAIADNSTATPTATLTATATTTSQTITASPGQTVYVRVKACNQFSCSGFSNQGSVPVPGSAPGVPTSVTITLTISP